MFDYKEKGNIVSVYFRGIYLGRLLKSRVTKKQRPYYTIIDRDFLSYYPHSKASEKIHGRFTDREEAATIMRDFRRPHNVAVA